MKMKPFFSAELCLLFGRSLILKELDNVYKLSFPAMVLASSALYVGVSPRASFKHI